MSLLSDAHISEPSPIEAGDGVPAARVVGLDLALARAKAGWPVHRLAPGTNRPATPHGFKDATTDLVQLAQMFAPGGNVGTPGTERDLILDIDVPKAGVSPTSEAELRQIASVRLSDLFDRFPETRSAPLVQTPSGGYHVYLTLPERFCGARQGESGFIPTGPFPRNAPKAERWGEVRGMERAYVAVWGCERQDGAYTAIREPGSPAEAPEASGELIAWLAGPAPSSRPEKVWLGAFEGDRERRVLQGDPTRYAEAILDGVGRRLAAQAKGGRHNATLDEGRILGRWVQGYDEAKLPGLTVEEARSVLEEATEANGYRGEEPRACDGTIRDGLRYGMAYPFDIAVENRRGQIRDHAPSVSGDKAEATAKHPARGSISAPPDLALLDFPQDDLGYACSIAHQHVPILRKHAGLGVLAYDEEEHRHVAGEAALARAHELAILTQRSIAATAQQIDDKGERGRWESYAKQLRARNKREAAIELLLRTDARVTDAEIDGDDFELNTPAGVLDLRTLTVTPHDPQRIFTTVTRASYRPDAKHWVWDAMFDLLREDGRAEYVQRALGQAITGRTNREMFVFVGPKATGKTTLGEGLATALGADLAAAVDPGTLLDAGRNRNPGGPRADLVALRAARLALTSEPNSRATLDGQTVKRLTGSDSITARAVHGRTPITFRPRFTIVMLANEVPAADWNDDALLSRLRLVPFRARPPEIDPRVRAALVDDPKQDAIDALFTWVADGAYAWIRDGFSMGEEPEIVRNATRRYRAENDPFALWAEDRIRFDQAEAVISVSDLHDDYTRWAGQNGVTEPQRVEALGKWLKAQAEAGVDIERKRAKGRSSWRGVRLVGPTG